jgi:hypothetical protein
MVPTAKMAHCDPLEMIVACPSRRDGFAHLLKDACLGGVGCENGLNNMATRFLDPQTSIRPWMDLSEAMMQPS